MQTSVLAYIRLPSTTSSTPDTALDIVLAKQRLNGLADFFNVTIIDFYVEQRLPNVTPYRDRPEIQKVMARLESKRGAESLLVENIVDLAPLTSDRNRFIDFFQKNMTCYFFCGSSSSSGYLNTAKPGDLYLLDRLRVN